MGIWMDRKFRDELHARDHWECVLCGLRLGRGEGEAVPVLGKRQAIQGEGLYGKASLFEKNHQPENLMTLCLPCQKKNTSRLAAERAHGWKRIRVDGRTFQRILTAAVARNMDLETYITQVMDENRTPGISGITGLLFDSQGEIHTLNDQAGWILDQKPRSAPMNGPDQLTNSSE